LKCYLKIVRTRRAEIAMWRGTARVNGVAFVHTRLANAYMLAGSRIGQLYHAALGSLAPHPQRRAAAKLLAEGILGSAVYDCLAGILKRWRLA
jgi:hypothetical protein